MRSDAVASRLGALRDVMRAEGIAACLIPSSDPHSSEYLPERWKGRAWLSGFTGSVGPMVVTHEQAAIWVDSRYWVQAEIELAGTEVVLMKVAAAGGSAHIEWLLAQLSGGDALAVDGQCLSVAATASLRAALEPKGVRLRLARDLVGAVWTDRPPLPAQAVFEHGEPWAGASRREKLGRVRAEMVRLGVQWHLISTLDDVAWLFNLRGADVEFNPYFVAHTLLGIQQARIFADPSKFSSELVGKLAADGVEVVPYDMLANALGGLPVGDALLLDPRRATSGIVDAAGEGVMRVEATNPTLLFKSRKTASELAHWRRTMAEDGAALAEFFCWLEGALANGEALTELTIDDRITAERARRPGYVSRSFATIAGFNANGAMPHYRATPESHVEIRGDGLLLIDSGAQYSGGTTDITRVVAVGQVSASQRRDYTLVLKGLIALTRARFPRGTHSGRLDTLARAPLWAEGLDYGHGTGHGVGYFLGVHEGPQSISPFAPALPETGMEPGMVTSNEPGIYRPGRWGVRLENLLLTVPILPPIEADANAGAEFLAFETLTLCPFDRRCIDRDRLSADECQWVDDYHAEVRRRVLPLLEGNAAAWLVRATKPLGG